MISKYFSTTLEFCTKAYLTKIIELMIVVPQYSNNCTIYLNAYSYII